MAGAVNVVLKSVFDDKGIKNAQAEFAKVGKSVGVAFAAVGAAIAVAGAAAVRFGGDAIKAAEGVRQANDRLAQVNKSMGLFGDQTSQVTQRLINFAEANELNVAVDAEVIKSTQAKLLTFKDLAQTADETGGAFDRATMAALDLAAAGFGSAETNAIQLGKALQDPIKGLTALRRAGVTFTEQEKENIKTLVESGKTLEAQNLILQSIEKQVGGTAAATATASEKMRLAFENIKEEVGAALLPAFDDMVDVVTRDLTPALEEVAKDVGPLLVKGLEVIAGVLKDATDESTPLGKSVKNLGEQFGILFDALAGGKSDIEGTSNTLSGLADIVSFLVTTMASFVAFLQTLGPAINALLKGDVEKFWEWLTSDPIDFLNNQQAAEDALKQTRKEFLNTADSARKLNNIRLDKLRSQLGDLRQDGNKLANQQRELYYAMQGKKPPTVGGGGDSGVGDGGVGETLAEKRLKQKKQFDELVKDTQKRIRDARAAVNKAVANANRQYREAVANAEKAFADATTNAIKRRDESLAQAAKENATRISEIQRDFSKRLTDIIRDSQNRLREAYRSAVATNIADLFTSEGVGQSVDKLVTELRNKLEASRRLIENASLLASQGFSQTFIEQVVSAGTTAGNELAESILTATPETQAELRSLFGALETQSERGMDSLASTIYEKTGLATSALRELYDQTVVEQTEALAEQARLYTEAQEGILTEFDRAMTEASDRRNEALAQAAKDLQDALKQAADDYKASLDDIEADFKKRIADLEQLSKDLLARQKIVQGQIDGAQANIPAVTKPIQEATKAQIVTIPPSKAITGQTININVKTDPTKSVAQTGKTIANVVQKYTSAGGGAGGSAMPWQVM